MTDTTLLAIEAELHTIQRDIAAGALTKHEAEELLRDIDVARFVATSADGLTKKTEVQALLDTTITMVSALA